MTAAMTTCFNLVPFFRQVDTRAGCAPVLRHFVADSREFAVDFSADLAVFRKAWIQESELAHSCVNATLNAHSTAGPRLGVAELENFGFDRPKELVETIIQVSLGKEASTRSDGDGVKSETSSDL